MMTCFIGVVVGGPGGALATAPGGVNDPPPPDEEQAAIENATNIGSSRRIIIPRYSPGERCIFYTGSRRQQALNYS